MGARRWRRLLFYPALVVGTLLVIESLSCLLLRVREGNVVVWGDFQDARLTLIDPSHQPASTTESVPVPTINGEVIHPYLGYVMNPREVRDHTELGFPGDEIPLRAASDNSFVIGVFGGSFAQGLCRHGGEILIERLHAEPALSGRQIVVRTFALGGYKQPQQLFALAFLLVLGAPLDVVVNIDGFNEVALSSAEYPRDLFPFYPRLWVARVENLIDPVMLRLIARVVDLEERQVSWARQFATTPLRFTMTGNLIWKIRNDNLFNASRRAAQRIEAHALRPRAEYSYLATGPAFEYRGEEAYFEQLAEVWRACSEQMHSLCEANRILYLHVLQPNQYVPGSKVLTPEERETAYEEEHPYRDGVLKGYPLLVQRGQELARAGVRFHDLTKVFDDLAEPIYVDSCCHVSPEGYRVIAERIAAAIAEAGIGPGDRDVPAKPEGQ